MSEPQPADDRKWLHELKRRDAERAHDASDEFFVKANEAAVANGTLALRTALLINGGAAVAMLAFIGGLLGQGKVPLAKTGDLASSLMWFAMGVACAAVGIGAAYFTNYTIAGSVASRIKNWDHPWVIDGPNTNWWKRGAQLFQCLAIAATLGALILFIIGMVDVRNSIGRL